LLNFILGKISYFCKTSALDQNPANIQYIYANKEASSHLFKKVKTRLQNQKFLVNLAVSGLMGILRHQPANNHTNRKVSLKTHDIGNIGHPEKSISKVGDTGTHSVAFRDCIEHKWCQSS